MHWIIQDNFYREAGYVTLIETLDRFDIPYDIVKVVPFTSDLSFDQQTIPPVDPVGMVVACGSVTLCKIAQRRGWTPGSFLNENHDYRVWKQYYGRSLLNFDSKVCRFDDVSRDWEEFFIRPCDDGKSFSGHCIGWDEFLSWKHKVIDLKECYTSLNADTMVSYGPMKTIRKEYRFFVVDGEIVGKSVYKVGNTVIYISLVDEEAIDFANKMIAIWTPARAFVLDVALTDDGMKVVEINNAMGSGFYAIDVANFVMSIENMEF